MSKLAKSVSAYQPSPFMVNGQFVAGYYDPTMLPFDNSKKYKYHEIIKFCRFYYDNDTIVGTVIDRMVDMAVTKLRNRKDRDNPEMAVEYYNAVAEYLQPYLKLMALDYFLHGMAIPEYTYETIMGNKIDPTLGRKRVQFPTNFWVRNAEYIELRRRPLGTERAVFIKIPDAEVNFIMTKGMRDDGSSDKEGYQEIAREYPAYIRAIMNGQRIFPLTDARPIYRKLRSYDDYPKPFLQNALYALQHKYYLKQMDRSIAARASELLRHVKIGSDTFPATDDDIKSTETVLANASVTGDRVFNLFTNHTVEIGWVTPPMDALLNEAKYIEPNADIFLALGFPRILAVGETMRSNATDNKTASLGPISTLNDLREALTSWVEMTYQDLAEKNGFSWWPKPFFSPIALQDITALTQLAIQAQQIGAISKDTIAQLYGTTYEEEQEKIETEYQEVPQNDTNQTGTPEEQQPTPGSGLQPEEPESTVQQPSSAHNKRKSGDKVRE
jgi:hypothetical protein